MDGSNVSTAAPKVRDYWFNTLFSAVSGNGVLCIGKTDFLSLFFHFSVTILKGEFDMKALEDKILREGTVLPGNILKVGSFLNQQIDVGFLLEMGEEINRLFSGCGITRILTVEASGIAVAVAAGAAMKLPVVFGKKHKTGNVSGETYKAVIHSYTHNTDYEVAVPCEYLHRGDKVLLVDDFLANGKALEGLCDIVKQAGAEVAGAAIAIEKGFQHGGDRLRESGVRVESLALIESMDGDTVIFRK